MGGSDAAVDARMRSIFDVKYCAWSSAVRQEVSSDCGCSNGRSLDHKFFDDSSMTSYWCSVVTMALCRAFSEIFIVEKYPDLEIPVKGQSKSLKVVPFDRLHMVSY